MARKMKNQHDGKGTKLPYGTLHPALQQFDAFEFDDPPPTSSSDKVDPTDIATWVQQWPPSAKAFYTPRLMSGGQSVCPYLTYGDLNEQMEQCPPWRRRTDWRLHEKAQIHASAEDRPRSSEGPFVVGVILPLDWMTELAVVHLCIMSGGPSRGDIPTCSAPLDPRTSRQGLLEALHQMDCQGLILSEDMMESFQLHFLLDDGNLKQGLTRSVGGGRVDELEKKLQTRITDVRVIESAPNGGVTWKIHACKGCQSDVTDAPKHASEDKCSKSDNGHEHPVLILRTSGTTSTPKLVPLRARQLYLNAKAQQRAMSLTDGDSTINSMPLFHIGGLSCSFFSVLVSGGSVIYSGKFEPSRFLEQVCGGNLGSSPGGGDAAAGTATMLTPGCLPEPTWFNAVPTMHKALLLSISTLDSAVQHRIKTCRKNPLRFIRSGAAQLGQDIVDDLKESLQTKEVINSYAMSECMPICVQPLGYHTDQASSNSAGFGPNVGVPVCPSVRISNPSTGQALEYDGGDGEICINGPSVISSYLNVPVSESHTSDGWLRTGDVGRMDPISGMITITGRVKELIKVGGEQVWPVQVDNCIVHAVDEVEIAITFGVPNVLWGEEVAVAIVLRNAERSSVSSDQSDLEYQIKEACRAELDEIAVPSQVLFIRADEIPRGTSGKYLRTQMASHLGVQSVNNGTLLVFEGLKKQKQIRELREGVKPISSSEVDVQNKGDDEEKDQGNPIPIKIQVDSSIDGARIIASCFVVMAHVGIYPNVGWEIIRNFNLSVPFFFVLAGFQLSLSVVGKIQWAAFVGTRIGHLQSLFVISQVLALPGFFLMRCGGGEMSAFTCDGNYYSKQILSWIFATMTGMLGVHNTSNFPSWFLTVIYQFMIIFPFVDRGTRSLRRATQTSLFVAFTGFATALSVIFFFIPGQDYESGVFSSLRRTIVVFFPTLYASMIMAYFFIKGAQNGSGQTHRSRRLWAFITDGMSLGFVLILVLAVVLNQCVWLPAETTLAMRPNVPLESYADTKPSGFGALTNGELFCVPAVSYSDFVEYLHDDPETPTQGRYPSMIVFYISILRMGTPLIMIWAYGLAKGAGWTAKLLRWRPLVSLSPLTYHLYLLHVPIARYYWFATRPSTYGNPPFWFGEEGLPYPFPIQWWEVLILIVLCLIVALGIERWITPHLQTHTVRFGLLICKHIVQAMRFFLRFLSCGRYQENGEEQEMVGGLEDVSTLSILEEKISALTGAMVTASSELDSLGLDSLGATALLSTIKSATPKASRLTVYDLYGLKTVGDLVSFIDNGCKPIERNEEQA